MVGGGGRLEGFGVCRWGGGMRVYKCLVCWAGARLTWGWVLAQCWRNMVYIECNRLGSLQSCVLCSGNYCFQVLVLGFQALCCACYLGRGGARKLFKSPCQSFSSAPFRPPTHPISLELLMF